MSNSTSDQREDRLLRAYARGDLGARDEVIQRFMPLARRLAKSYRHTGESQEDLEQVAYFGLIKASIVTTRNWGVRAVRGPNILGELKRHFATRAGGCT